jgi:hypothetical protein
MDEEESLNRAIYEEVAINQCHHADLDWRWIRTAMVTGSK